MLYFALFSSAYAQEKMTSSTKFSIPITPRITNFDKRDYKGENQNWDITVGNDGKVFFANTLGLLTYDGEDWNLFSTPDILHTIYYRNDTIYAGGNQFMGYFLTHNLKSGFHLIHNIEESIWKIFPIGRQMVFQAFSRFYLASPNGMLGYERLPGNITFSYPIDGKIYYQLVYGDLYSMDADGLKQKVEIPALHQFQVKSILKLQDGGLLLGTLRNGLYEWKNGQLNPINNSLNDALKAGKINKIAVLPNGLFAFGTMKAGLIIATLDGQIKYHLNSTNGLPNNRIHSIEFRDGHLWLGLDDGISVINLDSPATYINDFLEQLGAVYDICQQGDDYYIATNQGVYHGRDIFKSGVPVFELMPKADGQAWKLTELDGQIWCGHNEGTFLISGGKFEQISDVPGGFDFVRSKNQPNIIYQSAYYGIAVYKKQAGKWKYWTTIDQQLKERTRNIVEQPDGSLIVSTFNDHLLQVFPAADYKSAERVVSLKQQFDLPNLSNIRVFKVGQETVVTGKHKAFSIQQDGIEPLDAPLADAHYISKPIKGKMMISRNNQLHLYDLKQQEELPLSNNFSELANHLIYKYEHINTLSDSVFAVAMSSGVAFWNMKMKDHYHQPKNVSFTKVVAENKRNGAQKIIATSGTALPDKYNTIRFTFTAFEYGEQTHYMYQLKGFNKSWQDNGLKNDCEFQNLPYGSYTFLVKEKNADTATAYDFTIHAPWYLRPVAYLLYIALLIGLFLIGYKYHKGRLLVQRKNMLIAERRMINKTRTAHQEKLKALKERQLQEEIKAKNNELSKLLIQDSKKKEIIANLQHQLTELRENKKPLKIRDIEKLDNIIHESFDEKKDWLVFESAFSETHEHFFKRLQAKHPNLTTEDLKLCAYLKVNLTTKELAPIFNITPKSVELKRYRLRKKLSLEKGQSLKDYIVNL